MPHETNGLLVGRLLSSDLYVCLFDVGSVGSGWGVDGSD